MLLPLGTYLCRLSLRFLHPLGTVSAFAFLCIQRYTDNHAHAIETNIDCAGKCAGSIPNYPQVATKSYEDILDCFGHSWR
jgi:hypothetical protein